MPGFAGIARVSAIVPGLARSWRYRIGVVELVLRIRARRKGIPAMVQALATVMVQAGPQLGCVDCRLYTETGDPSSLCYVEQWSTVRDLQSQLRSPGFGMLLGIMETAAEAGMKPLMGRMTTVMQKVMTNPETADVLMPAMDGFNKAMAPPADSPAPAPTPAQ